MLHPFLPASPSPNQGAVEYGDMVEVDPSEIRRMFFFFFFQDPGNMSMDSWRAIFLYWHVPTQFVRKSVFRVYRNYPYYSRGRATNHG